MCFKRCVVESCCCGCCSLKAGAKIVAWFYFISYSIGTLYLIIMALDEKDVFKIWDIRSERHSYNVKFNVSWIYFAIPMNIIGVISSVFFIFGVYKGKKALYLPILIVSFIIVILSLIGYNYMSYQKEFKCSRIPFAIIIDAILIYCLVIVWSDYNQMENQADNPVNPNP